VISKVGKLFHPVAWYCRLPKRGSVSRRGRPSASCASALQSEFAQIGLKRLGVPVHIASGLTAGTRPAGPGKVGGVGIQPLLNHPRGGAQSLTAYGRFQRLEVQCCRGFPAHLTLDLSGEVVRQNLPECGFF